MPMNALLILLTLSKLASSSLYENNTLLVHLNPSNFDDVVTKSTDVWLVEFFSSTCPHCKAFAPHFERAADELKHVCRIGLVDFEDDGKYLMYRFNVRNLPSFKIFRPYRSRPEDYTGPRTGEDLVKKVLEVKNTFI